MLHHPFRPVALFHLLRPSLHYFCCRLRTQQSHSSCKYLGMFHPEQRSATVHGLLTWDDPID
ncbi:hypothetical protein HJC23_011991 [Cyclotella cryptica]|uniref:Uncharacterized protein n=1 Tax=Cyclotella cryptica TaxID=29204 RepID=A0ABD3QR02_9STRA